MITPIRNSCGGATILTMILVSQSLLYIGLLVVLVTFIWAIVGVHLFWAIEPNQSLNETFNFSNALRAMGLLLVLATGENFVGTCVFCGNLIRTATSTHDFGCVASLAMQLTMLYKSGIIVFDFAQLCRVTACSLSPTEVKWDGTPICTESEGNCGRSQLIVQLYFVMYSLIITFTTVSYLRLAATSLMNL